MQQMRIQALVSVGFCGQLPLITSVILYINILYYNNLSWTIQLYQLYYQLKLSNTNSLVM